MTSTFALSYSANRCTLPSTPGRAKSGALAPISSVLISGAAVATAATDRLIAIPAMILRTGLHIGSLLPIRGLYPCLMNVRHHMPTVYPFLSSAASLQSATNAQSADLERLCAVRALSS